MIIILNHAEYGRLHKNSALQLIFFTDRAWEFSQALGFPLLHCSDASSSVNLLLMALVSEQHFTFPTVKGVLGSKIKL